MNVLTSREQIILSFQKSLEPLLSQLSLDVTNEEALGRTAKGNTAKKSKEKKKSDIDETIEGFLTFVGAKFCLWIFEDFPNSTALQTELWVSFFYPVVNRYRTDVVGKYRDFDQDDSTAGDVALKRLHGACKRIGHFYKLFLARAIEIFGFTTQVHYVVSVLHLHPDTPRASSSPFASKDIVPILHQSFHDVLCHLGDLSRYRTASRCGVSTPLDYKYALIYYKTAFKIQPQSGIPLNQIGNICYSTGDIFSGVLYFLKSVSVADPFRDANSNLRIILRKLLKIKDSSLSKLRISGLAEESESDRDSVNGDLEVIEEEETPKSEWWLRTKKTAETKELLMRILQLYASYYISHIPTTKTGLNFDPKLSERVQFEFADEICQLTKSKEIPRQILVKLAIIGISFVFLLEQAKENQLSGNKALMSPVEAHTAVLRLTLYIMDGLLTAALYHADGDEYGVLNRVQRIKPAIGSLLPAFRVYFDWLRKQMTRNLLTEYCECIPECNTIFSKVARVLEYFREANGFRFDVVTAVAKPSWERFDEVLRLHEEGSYMGSNATATETDEPSSGLLDNIVKRNKKRLLYDNDEETHCSGLLPLGGGLDDTPNGLSAVTRKDRAALEVYRAQCLLFTGVEMSRSNYSFIELDEFAKDTSAFIFVGMEPSPDDILSDELQSELVLSQSDEEENIDDLFDEAELYDLFGSGPHSSELQRKTESASADSLRAYNLQQIESMPGQAVEGKNQGRLMARLSMSVSPSPKLHQNPQLFENKETHRPMDRPDSLIGEEQRKNFKSSEVSPEPDHTQTDRSQEQSEAESNEESDEEIVFLGRRRTAKE